MNTLSLRRRVLFLLMLALLPGLVGAQPHLEVRAWLYDTQNTPDRSDDNVVDPYGSDYDYYLQTDVIASGGMSMPARLNSGKKIWDVYSDGSTVYRLVFQIQSDQEHVIYNCEVSSDAFWMLWIPIYRWSYDDQGGVKELILTTDYNDGDSDPDLITDYESGWWLDPKDIGNQNAPDTTKDITQISYYSSLWSILDCVDAFRNWETDAYGEDTLYADTDSTMIWEIHFIVDEDWTDNDPIDIQLHMSSATPLDPTTDIRLRLQTTNPVRRWVYPPNGSIGGILSSPVIQGGRVYVGSDDANLYCLDASDGSLIWNYTAGDRIRSSPSAVDESGQWVIYFGSDDGYVYAVKDTGSSHEEKWKKDLGAVVNSSPALWDSLIYVGCSDDSIHCLRMSDGSQKWATYLYDDISSSPAVFNDIVYVGSESDDLYALNHLDGTVLRTYGTCGDIVAPVFLTWETGLVCIGSYASAAAGSDTMYIINASNFSTYWKFQDSQNLARTYTSCFSLNDTTVYFGNDNNRLYCIDLSDSTLDYTYDTGEDIHSTPLYWDGVVYFGSNSNRFYALDDATQQPRTNWPFVANWNIESSPAISVSDSLVVVGSSDGHVYGFYLE